MNKQIIQQPSDWPRGYSWKEWTENDNVLGHRSMEQFWDYVKGSISEDQPSKIVQLMQQVLDDAEADLPQDVKWVITHIITHKETHQYLKKIYDGSYRTNRIMIAPYSHFSHFTNYNFHRYMSNEIDYDKLENDRKDYNKTIELLNEIIEKDGVIFIQFDYTMHDDEEYEEYRDPF